MESLLKTGQYLNDVESADLILAKQKKDEQAALLKAKKEELALAKQLAKESRDSAVQKLTTERTTIVKTLHAGEKYASIADIAGAEAMDKIKRDYAPGGKNYTGKSRLSEIGEKYERDLEEEKESRRQGWSERANKARVDADKMLSILEKYGAAPKSERISDVVNQLVNVDKKLANLGVFIKGIQE